MTSHQSPSKGSSPLMSDCIQVIAYDCDCESQVDHKDECMKPFYVHSGLLCSVSDVFEKELNGPMREAKERKIHMVDCDSGTVERLIQYVYTGAYKSPEPKRRTPPATKPFEFYSRSRSRSASPLHSPSYLSHSPDYTRDPSPSPNWSVESLERGRVRNPIIPAANTSAAEASTTGNNAAPTSRSNIADLMTPPWAATSKRNRRIRVALPPGRTARFSFGGKPSAATPAALHDARSSIFSDTQPQLVPTSQCKLPLAIDCALPHQWVKSLVRNEKMFIPTETPSLSIFPTSQFNFRSCLIGESNMYALAHKYNIPLLQKLAYNNIKHLLENFSGLIPQHTIDEDIIPFIRCVYDNTYAGSKGQEEPLRNLTSTFAAWNVKTWSGDAWEQLLSECYDFTVDFFKKVRMRMRANQMVDEAEYLKNQP